MTVKSTFLPLVSSEPYKWLKASSFGSFMPGSYWWESGITNLTIHKWFRDIMIFFISSDLYMEVIRFFQLQGNPFWYHRLMFSPRWSAEANLLPLGNKVILRNVVTPLSLRILRSFFYLILRIDNNNNNYNNNNTLWWVSSGHINWYNHPKSHAMMKLLVIISGLEKWEALDWT